jgi:hypothetical protein
MTRYLDPEQGSSKPLVHLPLFDKFAGERATDEAPSVIQGNTPAILAKSIQSIASLRAMTSPAIHATARSADPETSRLAAEAFTEQRLTEIQSVVFELFTIRRRLTDEEIEDALSVKYPAFSTLRKRRTDLVQLGLIRDSGERKLNRNNRKMIVWEIA